MSRQGTHKSLCRAMLTVALPAHAGVWIFLYLRMEPFHTFFCSFASWSFLIALASWNELRSGGSFCLGQGKRIPFLLFVSILLWLLFEVCNFRLLNWRYVGVPFEQSLRWVGYLAAYAAILPTILEVERLFAALKLPGEKRARPLLLDRGVQVRLALLGILTILAALVSPESAFALIWIGTLLLFDLLAFHLSPDSHAARLIEGDYSRLFRLVIVGFVCGLLSEFWNYWAGAKWIYSPPYFQFAKVFEMPILGYLVFPFFALTCFSAWQTALALRDILARGRWTLRLLVLVAGLAFLGWALSGIDRHAVATYQVFRMGG
ncbi:MAG TPA: hypothetical protein P5057_06440 [Acidobacteriota bacterium]|nr:hypothetical protein [Acidobacteriota bacterium]